MEDHDMHLDLDALVWPGRHQPVLAMDGMVAASQPLVSSVGLAVLREGGNAVDAAVAMGAATTVVEPATSSIGGDAFALVWDGERLHGLNGSGRAPAGLSANVMRRQGHAAMPERGWLTVTVPGVPAAWRDLHARFGKLPFARLIEPARDYAEAWASWRSHSGACRAPFAAITPPPASRPPDRTRKRSPPPSR
jgi:gamma-glutamyltranspeptidase/glutathione hydrolase